MRKTLEKLWAMKPKEFRSSVNDYDIINIYLEEFFDTTFQAEKGKDIYNKIDDEFSPESWSLFFKNFRVTKQQHDWWYNELINLLSKKHSMSKERVKKSLNWIDLQIGPSIKRDEHNI